jgi:hypothetical protein
VSWQQVAVIAFTTFQVIALAWIAAWQQRAAHERRKATDELPQRVADRINGSAG